MEDVSLQTIKQAIGDSALQPDAGQSSATEEAVQPVATLGSDLELSLAETVSALAEREARMADLSATLEQRDAELAALRERLAQTVSRYREALLATTPTVPAELVQGTTPEELEASLAQGRQLVERVRASLESQQAQQRVPAGAPVRTAADISGLSAREKIAAGLARTGR